VPPPARDAVLAGPTSTGRSFVALPVRPGERGPPQARVQPHRTEARPEVAPRRGGAREGRVPSGRGNPGFPASARAKRDARADMRSSARIRPDVVLVAICPSGPGDTTVTSSPSHSIWKGLSQASSCASSGRAVRPRRASPSTGTRRPDGRRCTSGRRTGPSVRRLSCCRYAPSSRARQHCDTTAGGDERHDDHHDHDLHERHAFAARLCRRARRGVIAPRPSLGSHASASLPPCPRACSLDVVVVEKRAARPAEITSAPSGSWRPGHRTYSGLPQPSSASSRG